MKFATQVVTIIAFIFLSPPLHGADNDAKAPKQFQVILKGINEHSFTPIQRSLDRNELTARIYGIRPVDVEVMKVFDENFWQIVQEVFNGVSTSVESGIKGELVHFEFKDGVGRAVVRFRQPQYEYEYHDFQLRHDSRGRLKIVDFLSYNAGQTLSAEVSEFLMVVLPSKGATRRLVKAINVTDRELFQLTEILKAARDRDMARFFEIYDDLPEGLQREMLIAKFAALIALSGRDADRFTKTFPIFQELFEGNPDFSLLLTDLLLRLQEYEKGYESLLKFHDRLAIKEGATPARLSALALALGKRQEAEQYAVEATMNEPTLELGWWSLLRARSTAGNFAGATEVLTHLENDFGHKLDAAKLKRDRFRGFIRLAASQEFRDWRASRE